jgi:guanylate kinase
LSEESLIVVITAPSGSGKTTICRKLGERRPDLNFSVSHTTRPIREGEKDGVDYHFVSFQEFRSKVDGDDFVEWAEVHGELKGTTREALLLCRAGTRICMLDLDVQGAFSMMEKYPEAVTIFIEPPSLEELEKRLRERGTENPEKIEVRLRNAAKELEHKNRFQYIVVNDLVERSVREIEGILDQELARRSR